MNLKTLSRGLLYFTFFFNIFGFLGFAFPQVFGQSAGLPAPPQLVYSLNMALVILMWAFIYLYLARQKEFNRPLFWVGALSKLVFFSALLISWAVGELSGKMVLAGAIDLTMGIVWLSYLITSRRETKGAVGHA